jgi:hypothetical protein
LNQSKEGATKNFEGSKSNGAADQGGGTCMVVGIASPVGLKARLQ